MKVYTKDLLIQKLIEISNSGWIQNRRQGNDGGIGNTLEDLLEINENNLPLPNAAEWELKSQRLNTSSLTTLFHMEPSPRAMKLIPSLMLPNYGWKHKEAGKKYPKTEKSFRMTIKATNVSDRGFCVNIDRDNQKVLISFDSSKVSDENTDWKRSIEKAVGLDEINPQPYWGFDDLKHKAGTKLLNAFYVQAEVKKEVIEGNKVEFYRYSKILMLQKFSFDGFLNQLEEGNIFVDFDARTGHNHGSKFRLKQNYLPALYEKVKVIK